MRTNNKKATFLNWKEEYLSELKTIQECEESSRCDIYLYAVPKIVKLGYKIGGKTINLDDEGDFECAVDDYQDQAEG